MPYPTDEVLVSGAPAAPIPSDAWENTRWAETRRRRRLLDGTWAEDYRQRRKEHLGTEREEAVGPTSLVLNPLRNICSELARLYDEPPEVYHPRLALTDEATLQTAYRAAGIANDGSDQGALRRALIHDELLARGDLPLESFNLELKRAKLWTKMPRFQEYALACREYGLNPALINGRLVFREVYPDHVLAQADPSDPAQPHVLWELRLRGVAGRQIWTWDVYDVRDPAHPVYAIHEATQDARRGADITSQVLGGAWSGAAYPFTSADGEPFIPTEIYHAAQLGDRLWDPWRWIELTEGTLDLAVLYAFVVHVFRDASWPQRWTVNCELVGGEVATDQGAERREYVTDPATVVNFRGKTDAEGGGQPMVGQWQAGGDAEKLDAVLAGMVQRCAADVGVSLADVQRVSDAARSGVAITLTNEGKRAAQRRFREHFRPSDEGIVAKAAKLINRGRGGSLPEDGWEIRYRELPLSADEIAARDDHVIKLLDRGLISQVDAYRKVHGCSPTQAEFELSRIRMERLTNTLPLR